MSDQNTNAPFKDLFISYGRRESLGFVGRLHQQLKLSGYDVWFDKVNIPDGEDYAARINHGIESAHNFAYVMAPRCLTSPYCLIELEYARILGKRVIPINQMVIFQTSDQTLSTGDQNVLHSFYQFHGIPDPDIQTTQEVLNRSLALIGKTDWLDAKEALSDTDCEQLRDWAQTYENYWNKHDDLNYLDTFQFPVFGYPIDPLPSVVERITTVLERHRPYVEQHTQLLAQALQWQQNQHLTQHLIVGKERTAAEQWLLTRFQEGEQPPCTPNTLQCDFLCEARKNAENRMTDVFMCYDTHDKAVRDQIIHALSRYAITVWTHDQDIQKGSDYAQAIEQGIEHADNLLFLISPQSVVSDYCLQELNHALKYHKRIIPLVITPTDPNALPEFLRKLQYIVYQDGAIDEIYAVLEQDKVYYEQHKILLARALQWQAEGCQNSFLLRGYNLANAQTWLRLNQHRQEHPPTSHHHQLIEASEAAKGQLGTEVFISYSRKDGDFARRLNLALQQAGKTTWFDQESISSGVDFETEIFKGISNADNFIFILSPDAVHSEYCEREVNFAADQQKRFIPVLWRDTLPEHIPTELRRIQWLNFTESPFEDTFAKLIQTIELDREHTHQHTVLQQRATDWEKSDHHTDFLLNRTACANAITWLDQAQADHKHPPPTPLQHTFIQTSQQIIEQADSAERERRARELRIEKKARQTMTKLLTQERQSSKRQRLFLSLIGIGFVISLIIGGYAFDQKYQVEQQKNQIEQQKRQVEQQKDTAEQALQTAKQAKMEADRQRHLAEDALADALRSKQVAQQAKTQAEQERSYAIEQEARAKHEAQLAEKARQQAEIHKRQAQQEAERAKEQAEIAERERQYAYQQTQIADYQTNRAEQQTYIAQRERSNAIKQGKIAQQQIIFANEQSFIATQAQQETQRTKQQLKDLFEKYQVAINKQQQAEQKLKRAYQQLRQANQELEQVLDEQYEETEPDTQKSEQPLIRTLSFSLLQEQTEPDRHQEKTEQDIQKAEQRVAEAERQFEEAKNELIAAQKEVQQLEEQLEGLIRELVQIEEFESILNELQQLKSESAQLTEQQAADAKERAKEAKNQAQEIQQRAKKSAGIQYQVTQIQRLTQQVKFIAEQAEITADRVELTLQEQRIQAAKEQAQQAEELAWYAQGLLQQAENQTNKIQPVLIVAPPDTTQQLLEQALLEAKLAKADANDARQQAQQAEQRAQQAEQQTQQAEQRAQQAEQRAEQAEQRVKEIQPIFISNPSVEPDSQQLIIEEEDSTIQIEPIRFYTQFVKHEAEDARYIIDLAKEQAQRVKEQIGEVQKQVTPIKTRAKILKVARSAADSTPIDLITQADEQLKRAVELVLLAEEKAQLAAGSLAQLEQQQITQLTDKEVVRQQVQEAHQQARDAEQFAQQAKQLMEKAENQVKEAQFILIATSHFPSAPSGITQPVQKARLYAQFAKDEASNARQIASQTLQQLKETKLPTQKINEVAGLLEEAIALADDAMEQASSAEQAADQAQTTNHEPQAHQAEQDTHQALIQAQQAKQIAWQAKQQAEEIERQAAKEVIQLAQEAVNQANQQAQAANKARQQAQEALIQAQQIANTEADKARQQAQEANQAKQQVEKANQDKQRAEIEAKAAKQQAQEANRAKQQAELEANQAKQQAQEASWAKQQWEAKAKEAQQQAQEANQAKRQAELEANQAQQQVQAANQAQQQCEAEVKETKQQVQAANQAQQQCEAEVKEIKQQARKENQVKQCEAEVREAQQQCEAEAKWQIQAANQAQQQCEAEVKEAKRQAEYAKEQVEADKAKQQAECEANNTTPQPGGVVNTKQQTVPTVTKDPVELGTTVTKDPVELGTEYLLVANDDSVIIDKNVPTSISVLDNDKGPSLQPNGITLTACHNTAHGGTVTPDNDNCVYTPFSNICGIEDEFTYEIQDTAGSIASATVTVIINCPTFTAYPPTAYDDDAVIYENMSAIIPVLSNDTDPDLPPNGADMINVTRCYYASHGTVTKGIDNCLYTPPPDQCDIQDSFTYDIRDTAGNTDSAIVTVTISCRPNVPPNAVNDNATTSQDTRVSIPVLENDSDLDGDGISISSCNNDATHGGTAAKNGNYCVYIPPPSQCDIQDTFTYEIQDTAGHFSPAATVTVFVECTNASPNALDDYIKIIQDTEVTIEVLQNDSDPEGDEISVVSCNNDAANGGIVTQDDNNNCVYTPPLGQCHIKDTFTYEVRDNIDNRSLATVTVAIDCPPNAPPNAINDNAHTSQDTKVTIKVLANDSDPEGDEISITSCNDDAAHGGTVVKNGDYCVYIPNPTICSIEDTFTYEIQDTAGNPSKATVTVTINCPPEAINDNANTQQESTVSIPVLANDRDPNEDDEISLSSCNNDTINGGTVTQDGDNCVYTPSQMKCINNQADTFTYEVQDTAGNSALATVTVIINCLLNAPPVAVDDLVTITQETEVTIEVLDNDSDPEGDPINLISCNDNAINGGTVKKDGNNCIYQVPLGLCDAQKLDYFTYEIQDTAGNSAQANVVIKCSDRLTAVNDPVVINYHTDESKTDPDNKIVVEKVEIKVLENDRDPDKNEIIEVTSCNEDNQETAQGGEVYKNGNSCFYTPNQETCEIEDSFPYGITNQAGDTASATVTVAINCPPVAVDHEVIVGYNEENQEANIAIPILEIEGISDPNEGDEIRLVSCSHPSSGFGVSSSAVEIQDNNCVYTKEMNLCSETKESFEYAVQDSAGNTARATITVTVNCLVEVVEATDDFVNIPENTSVTVKVLDNDSPLGGIKLQSCNSPTTAGGIVEPDGDNCIYTPPTDECGTQPDTFTYKITDTEDNNPVEATVTVTINCKDEEIPVVSQLQAEDDNAVTEKNTEVYIPVLENDSGDQISLTCNDSTQGGTAVKVGDKCLYNPPSNLCGTDTFTYQITDSENKTASGIVTVIIPCPISESTDNKTPLPVPVLENGSPEGISLRSCNIKNNILGKATPEGNNCVYTPPPNLCGMDDTFTYQIQDSAGNTALETVTVTIKCPPAGTKEVTITQDTEKSIPINPADGVLISCNNGNETTNKGGKVTLGSNSCVYQALLAQCNITDTFTYEIQDTENNLLEGIVTVQIECAPPTALYDVITLTQDESKNIPVLELIEDKVNVNGSIQLDKCYKLNTLNSSVKQDGDKCLYTPPPGQCGIQDSFAYTVKDGAGYRATATVIVSISCPEGVTEDPPTAHDDFVHVYGNEEIPISVLNNDIDPNLPPNGKDIISVTVCHSPTAGTVEVDANGEGCVYTPSPQSSCSDYDTFKYDIQDTAGNTSQATVGLSRECGDPPNARDDNNNIAYENREVSISVLDNDNGYSGGKSILLLNCFGKGNHYSNYKPETKYGGTVKPEGNHCVYEPPPYKCGIQDVFLYEIEGTNGYDTATVTVDVNCSLGAPIANQDTIGPIVQDQFISIPVLDNDADPDGEDSIELLDCDSPSAQGGQVTLSGKNCDYEPPPGQCDIRDSFWYEVEDSSGYRAAATVVVDIECP